MGAPAIAQPGTTTRKIPVENVCLQSARCNQHIQTSMDIAEVLEWLGGSQIATRAPGCAGSPRAIVRKAAEWRQLLDEFSQFS